MHIPSPKPPHKKKKKKKRTPIERIRSICYCLQRVEHAIQATVVRYRLNMYCSFLPPSSILGPVQTRGRSSHLITAGILAVPVSAKSFMSSDRRSCASSVLVISDTSRTSRPGPAVSAGPPPLADPFILAAEEGGDASLETDAGGREDSLVTLPAPGAI